MTEAATAAWQADMRSIHEQAGGVLELVVILPTDMPVLATRALFGDREAGAILTAMTYAETGIRKAPKRRPMLCVSCPRPLLGGRYTHVVAIPSRDDPTKAIGLAVCHRCATEPDAITAKAVEGLRNGLWPDLRPVTLTNRTGGRA